MGGRGSGGGGGGEATVTVFIFAKCRPPHPKISYFFSSSFSRKCLSPPVFLFLLILCFSATFFLLLPRLNLHTDVSCHT